MLSINPSINKLRDLCKVITGRTSSTPLARINRHLGRYREEYFVKFSSRPVMQALGRRPTTVSLNVEALVNGRSVGVQTLTLPTSMQDLLNALSAVDARAEQHLGLNYGGARARQRTGGFE